MSTKDERWFDPVSVGGRRRVAGRVAGRAGVGGPGLAGPDALIGPWPSASWSASRRLLRRRWLDGREALADYLGCSVSRVKDLRQRGLPGRQIGKRVLFDRIEVDRFLEQS